MVLRLAAKGLAQKSANVLPSPDDGVNSRENSQVRLHDNKVNDEIDDFMRRTLKNQSSFGKAAAEGLKRDSSNPNAHGSLVRVKSPELALGSENYNT